MVAYVAISVLACGNRKQQSRIISSDIISETVVGKKIPIIDSLYQDNKGERYLVLLCSPYDCTPCLDKAFEILNLINQTTVSNSKWVISVLDEPSSLQRQYNYFDYIIFDGEDVIRKSLKYIPTPVFLMADSANVIMACHFPAIEDDSYTVLNLIINNLNPSNYEKI